MSTENIQDKAYCTCLYPLNCSKCGKPMANRDETRSLLEALNDRPEVANMFANGPIVLSDIPKSAKKESVDVGIDEAGRGSAIGPMIYGAAFWSASKENDVPKGFQDSKALSEETRKKLYGQLLDHEDIGFCVKVFWPAEISRNMMRERPYNLNQMSHDAAMIMIQKILDSGVQIRTCYVDTVGNPASYQTKLERTFSGVRFVVESKADAKYAPCSAASVVAKVTRDRLLREWKFSGPSIENQDIESAAKFGSGYPSDPACKAYLENVHDPIFGYNDSVRFSWGPAKKKVEEHCVQVTFAADNDDDERDGQFQLNTLSFGKKRKRGAYFTKRQMKVVADWGPE